MINKIKKYKYINSLILLIVGLLLVIFNKLIYSYAFTLIGTLLIVFGILKFLLSLFIKNNTTNNFTSFSLFSSISYVLFGLFVIIFGESLTKILLIIFLVYLLINSIYKVINITKLINVHKPFIYELVPAILELILCLIILFNISKSIEIFIITIGIFLIIQSISSFYNTYKGKDEEIIEVEIIEKNQE